MEGVRGVTGVVLFHKIVLKWSKLLIAQKPQKSKSQKSQKPKNPRIPKNPKGSKALIDQNWSELIRSRTNQNQLERIRID